MESFCIVTGNYVFRGIVGQLRPSIVRKMLKLWDFALSLIKA